MSIDPGSEYLPAWELVFVGQLPGPAPSELYWGTCATFCLQNVAFFLGVSGPKVEGTVVRFGIWACFF